MKKFTFYIYMYIEVLEHNSNYLSDSNSDITVCGKD